MNTKITRITTLTEKVEEAARKEAFEYFDDNTAIEIDRLLDRIQTRRNALLQGDVHHSTHLLAMQEKIQAYADIATDKTLQDMLVFLPTLYKMTIELIMNPNASTNFTPFYKEHNPSKTINNLLYGYGFSVPKGTRKNMA